MNTVGAGKVFARTIVITPTYNEAANIVALLREVMAIPAISAIVVVDDNSPDGTGNLVRALQGEIPGIHLLQPSRRLGRGGSAIAGLLKAMELGADRVIEMDSDLSHAPRFIPALLDASERYDLVIGSRLVAGGDDEQRPKFRRLLTRLSCAYVRRVLGMAVGDPTSGFRCYSSELLAAIDLSQLISTGPSELLEILHRSLLAGFTVGEVPIAFTDRQLGRSKLHIFLLLDTMRMVIKLRILHGKGSR